MNLTMNSVPLQSGFNSRYRNCFLPLFFNITTSSLKEAQLTLKEQNHVSRLRLCDWPGLGYLQCDKVNVPCDVSFSSSNRILTFRNLLLPRQLTELGHKPRHSVLPRLQRTESNELGL